jgi:hypothetical protein
VQLLVARAARPQRELLDAVAAERRMRVAVDEPREPAQPAPVELLDVAGDRSELGHAPERLHLAVAAEHVGVLEHRHVAQHRAPQRRRGGRRRRQLRKVANQ